MDAALNEVKQILESINDGEARIPGTLLYNEGWLLRLVLSAGSRGIDCLPFRFDPKARWFSEALLHSRFLPRFRGDRLAESLTHADGVIGHFLFGAATRAGLELEPNCSQFVVCEAKIFSALSAGTKRAPEFDQAARNVGCIAETLRRAGRPLSALRSLGFFVLAPSAQIEAGIFSSAMKREGIRQRLTERVQMYDGESNQTELKEWLEDWAFPLVERIEIDCCPWESIINRVSKAQAKYGASLDEFYQLCLKYNADTNMGAKGR